MSSFYRRLTIAELASLPLRDMVRRNAAIDWRNIDSLYVGSNNKNLCTTYRFREFAAGCLKHAGISSHVAAQQFSGSYCAGMAALAQASLDVESGGGQVAVVLGVGWHGDDSATPRIVDDFYFTNLNERVARREKIASHYRVASELRDAYILSAFTNAGHARKSGFYERECMLVKRTDTKHLAYFREDDIEFVASPDAAEVTKMEKIVQLKPALRAGFAPAAEGACGLVLASRQGIDLLGLRPRVRVMAQAITESAVDLSTPYCIPAIEQVLDQAALSISQLDMLEISETCSVEVLGIMRHFDITLESGKVNGNGGDLAVGEASGASSVRLVVTAMNKLQANNLRYGLCAASSSDGRGMAILLENLVEC
ncbi:hypothetical protein HCU74_14650 [Spongiibacter sp. KMU-166]|uniref:Thiolase C-terminal domain-containing protein n=2 Tax=Spongiibacter thalassae TaxID=2721624 RepID=A0ABX1GJK5_9GAMM|nr:hypothetical protein [Spongiibacter thalassae]